MKWLSAVRHLVTHCTPFRFCIRFILAMAKIFSGLALTPHSETMNPRNIPLGTPKNTFLGIEFDVVHLELRESFF
jgi:hypothetical protein